MFLILRLSVYAGRGIARRRIPCTSVYIPLFRFSSFTSYRTGAALRCHAIVRIVLMAHW